MDWDDNRLGRHFKLRNLHVLMTVIERRSMGAAAAQLAVSQPAISKAISDMEHELGVRLLDRSPQGVEPTIYARALLDSGIAAFDELRQGIKRIEALTDPTAGELRIGSSIVLASSFVSAVVAQLSSLHPRIVFHLWAATAETSYRALIDRKIDVLVARIFEPLVTEQLQEERLYEEPHVVVAGAQSPWAQRRQLKLKDVIDEPWTLPPPATAYGTLYVEPFLYEGLEPPRTTVFSYTNPVRHALAASGRFLTIVPESVLKFPIANPALKRLPIDLPTTHRPVSLITLKNRTISPVAQLFIECAREFAKSLAPARKAKRGAVAHRTDSRSGKSPLR